MSGTDDFAAHRDAIRNAYSQAAAYTNIVIGAGYAGFFAIWSLTKDTIGPNRSALAGLLVLTSLFFFVLFEIIKMVYTTIELEKQAKALSKPEQYKELMAAFSEIEPRMAFQLRVLWYIFFSISFLTSFSAAAIMACAFVRQLLSHP